MRRAAAKIEMRSLFGVARVQIKFAAGERYLGHSGRQGPGKRKPDAPPVLKSQSMGQAAHLRKEYSTC